MPTKVCRNLLEVFLPKKRLDNLKLQLPREELLRRSRILIIDDEEIDLIDDLKAARFSVDHAHDIDSKNMDLIDRPVHDLILLDFGNVGRKFGNDEGLSLLKHIKRVNPAVVVFAYTSKSLDTGHSDFYILADGVLSKDAGVQESTEKIEQGLKKARSLENIWQAILHIRGVEAGSDDDLALQDQFVRGLTDKTKLDKFKSSILSGVTSDNIVQAVAQNLVSTLIELGMKAAI